MRLNIVVSPHYGGATVLGAFTDSKVAEKVRELDERQGGDPFVVVVPLNKHWREGKNFGPIAWRKP